MNVRNFADDVQILDLLPAAVVTAGANGSGVDLQSFIEDVAIVLDCGNTAGATPTMDVKVQDSDDNSTFADVSAAAFTQVTTVASVQKLALSKGSLRRYIRVVTAIGGTSSPAYAMSVKGYAFKKRY